MRHSLRYKRGVSIVTKEEKTGPFLTSQPLEDREIDESVAVLRRGYLEHKRVWGARKPIDSKKIESEISTLKKAEAIIRKKGRPVLAPEDMTPLKNLSQGLIEEVEKASSFQRLADDVRAVADDLSELSHSYFRPIREGLLSLTLAIWRTAWPTFLRKKALARVGR
jgi:hypothetical protein